MCYSHIDEWNEYFYALSADGIIDNWQDKKENIELRLGMTNKNIIER